jgi:hypothetical protein
MKEGRKEGRKERKKAGRKEGRETYDRHTIHAGLGQEVHLKGSILRKDKGGRKEGFQGRKEGFQGRKKEERKE